MKKTLLTSLMVLFTVFIANAEIITVNNSPIPGGMYTNLQDALDAAQTGDTIYVHPSPDSYGSVKINKRLVIMGGGYSPDSTQFQWPSTTGSITLDSVALTNPISGTSITGLNVSGTINGDAGIKNVLIERCYVSSYVYVIGDGAIIRNNIINYLDIKNHSNVLIVENFIKNISNSNKSSVLIANNILSGSFYSMSYAIVSNNIFWFCNISNFSYSTFNNNITYAVDTQTLPYGTNTGSNNVHADPKFNDATIPLSAVSVGNAITYDWSLSDASPGISAGTDGTDIGMYGGGYPMPNMTGAPALPQITNMTVNNSVVPVDGTLNVTVKARKQK
ncbi:MAG TPA: hypothetical protein VE912_18410 [Bacteroidales bacterium]|nr:hypothetical protein [Bacteroidales bacterium]